MDRAERKRRSRQVEAWNKRQTFTQAEVIQGNYEAYEVAVGHALDAAAAAFGIGETRVTRFQEKLQVIQRADGIGEAAARKPKLEEAALTFDKIYKFHKEVVAQLNVEAYRVGIDHIKDAVSIIYGLGPKRLAEYEKCLQRIQEDDDLGAFEQDGNPYALHMRRTTRRESTRHLHKRSYESIDKLVTP